MVCGKKASQKKKGFEAMTNSQLKDVVQKRFPKVPLLSSMKRTDLCYLAVPQEQLLKNFIKNDGANSCYLDSCLVALLAASRNGNSWMHKHIWFSKPKEIWHAHSKLASTAEKIQAELRNLLYPIDAPVAAQDASNLRKLFKLFDRHYEASLHVKLSPPMEWLRTQSDPTDVIQALYRVFQIKDDAVALLGKHKQKVGISAAQIDVFTLKEKKNVTLDAKPFIVNQMLKANLLYVVVQRNYLDEQKIQTPVLPPHHIGLRSNNNVMKLSAIVLHVGSSPQAGHYVSYVCNHTTGAWYLYDDFQSRLVPKGTFKDITRDMFVLKNLVGLVYS